MTECKTFSSSFEFLVYRWTKPHHWFFGGEEPYSIARKSITIQGDSIEEIELKRDKITEQLREQYPLDKFRVKVYIA